MRLLRSVVLGLAASTAMGCTADNGRIAGVYATGSVLLAAYVDVNGNGQLDANVDANAGGIHISLAPWGGGAAITGGTTAAGGTLLLTDVPVGYYRVQVDSLSAGDSLQAALQVPDLTVSAGDTAAFLVPLTFPRRTVAEARQLPVGRRVIVEGIALSSAAAFPDTSAYLADATGSIRLLRVKAAAFQAGDTIRVTGTRGSRDGQPTLTDASVFLLGSGVPPVPHTLTAAAAAGAQGGTLDAALARVTGLTIVSAQTVGAGDVQITATDATGTLQVFIDRTTGPITDPLGPGAVLDVTGVLVPIPGGTGWRLRPRSAADVSAHYPTVTTVQLRQLAVGKPVVLVATALNGSHDFGDNTVNVADAVGSLRVINVSSTVFAGDSLRLIGSVAVAVGQPVLSVSGVTVLGPGHLPAAVDRSTGSAASAAGGQLDAALVRVSGATISDTASIGTAYFRLTVNDGSGALHVLLDVNAGERNYTADVPGELLDVTGLLVPETAGGTWILKPRKPADIVRH